MVRVPIYRPQVDPSVGVGQARRSADDYGAAVGRALGQAEDVLRGEMQRARALAEQRRRDDARVAANKAAAQLSADAGKAAIELRQRSAPGGEGHPEAALSAFDAAADRARQSISDPDAARWFDEEVSQQRARFDLSENAWAAGARVERMVNDYQSAVDLDRSALFTNPNPGVLVETLKRHVSTINGLSLPDDQKAKLDRETREELGLSFARGLRQKDPQALLGIIKRGELNGLVDPDKLQALYEGAETEIRMAEAQARRERAEREREAREARRDAERAAHDSINSFLAYINEGGQVTPRQVGDVRMLAAQLGDNALRLRAENLGARALTVQGLRGRTPVEIQAEVNALSAEINRLGPNAPHTLLASRDAAQGFLTTAKTQLAQDPLSFAASQGVVSLPPLSNDPASWQARVSAAKKVQGRYGGPLVVMTDEEAGSWAAAVAKGGAEGAQAIQQLQAFGRDGALAAARQVAPKDPFAAHLIGLAQQSGGAGVVLKVMQGRDLLKAKPKIIDKTQAEAEESDLFGDALRFRPDFRAAAADTGRALYASNQTRAGDGDGFDRDAYRSNLNAALGARRGIDGVVRGGRGTDATGKATILPSWASQDEFDQALANLSDERLTAAGADRPTDAAGRPIPADAIRRGRLISVGDGLYQVIPRGYADSNFAMTQGGRAFVLRMRRRGDR